jgi:hypothetical protein
MYGFEDYTRIKHVMANDALTGCVLRPRPRPGPAR